MSIFDSLTFVIKVSGEMIAHNGEDSFFYDASCNNDLFCMGVFDGCGGAGSRKYSKYGLDNKTGAWIASRTASNFTENFYRNNEFKCFPNNQNDDEKRFEKSLFEEFSNIKHQCHPNSLTIKGSLVKSFPTTANIVVLKKIQTSEFFCEFLSAGDSRGYVLLHEGLIQITEDDIDKTQDANTNLTNDSILTNTVNADSQFEIHRNICNIRTDKFILITATDGAFAYFRSPMEFEYAILHTMFKSDQGEKWEKNLGEYIMKYTGDDVTILMAVFGFTKFSEIKEYFENRYNDLTNKYINPLRGISEQQYEEKKEILWEEYKKTYYSEKVTRMGDDLL